MEGVLLIKRYRKQHLGCLVDDDGDSFLLTYSFHDGVVPHLCLMGKTDQPDPSLTQWLSEVWRPTRRP